MGSVYKGVWVPGGTGFTGSSFMDGWHIAESKTWFSVPEWFPFWKWKSFGLQHHVRRDNEFDVDEVARLLKHYQIKVAYHSNNSHEVVTETDITDPNDVNVCREAAPSEYLRMVTAHNQAGDYIGDLAHAHYLMEKGIFTPIKKRSDCNNCSVGHSVFDDKYHGWSHRATYSFGIGSTVKKGDCAYTPVDKQDFMDDCTRFWSDEDNLNVFSEEAEKTHEDGTKEMGVRTTWTYSNTIPNVKLRGEVTSVWCPYPDTWGKGEWTAETMDDARQMAIDFSDGVS